MSAKKCIVEQDLEAVTRQILKGIKNSIRIIWSNACVSTLCSFHQRVLNSANYVITLCGVGSFHQRWDGFSRRFAMLLRKRELN